MVEDALGGGPTLTGTQNGTQNGGQLEHLLKRGRGMRGKSLGICWEMDGESAEISGGLTRLWLGMTRNRIRSNVRSGIINWPEIGRGWGKKLLCTVVPEQTCSRRDTTLDGVSSGTHNPVVEMGDLTSKAEWARTNVAINFPDLMEDFEIEADASPGDERHASIRCQTLETKEGTPGLRRMGRLAAMIPSSDDPRGFFAEYVDVYTQVRAQFGGFSPGWTNPIVTAGNDHSLHHGQIGHSRHLFGVRTKA